MSVSEELPCEDLAGKPTAIMLTNPHFHELAPEGEECIVDTIKIRSADHLYILTYPGPLAMVAANIAKRMGVRKVVVIESATSISSRVEVREPVVISSAIPVLEDAHEVIAPPLTPAVGDFELVKSLAESIEKTGLALSAPIPPSFLQRVIEKWRRIEPLVIDFDSAYLYLYSQVSMIRLAVVAVIDSSIPKGISREDVWKPGSRYFNDVVENVNAAIRSAKEAML